MRASRSFWLLFQIFCRSRENMSVKLIEQIVNEKYIDIDPEILKKVKVNYTKEFLFILILKCAQNNVCHAAEVPS